MARTKTGASRLGLYSFSPTPTNPNTQGPPLIALATTALPSKPIHTAAYLEQDPEVLRAAQILVKIYHEDISSILPRQARARTIGRLPIYAYNSDVTSQVLTPTQCDKDEGFEMQASPPTQVAGQAAKRSSTKGRMFTNKPNRQKVESAREAANFQIKAIECFEHPIQKTIYNSPAKKSTPNRQGNYQHHNEDDDGGITVVNSPLYSNDSEANFENGRDQAHIHPRMSTMLDRSFSTISCPKVSHGPISKPAGYTTPLGPSMLPIYASSFQSTTIPTQQSSSTYPQVPWTPSPHGASYSAGPSSVTGLQQFLIEARHARGHRRTKRLEDSAFFENTTRAHELLGAENIYWVEETGNDEGDMDRDRPSLLNVADTWNGGYMEEEGDADDVALEACAPSVGVEDDADGREEGEISDDGVVCWCRPYSGGSSSRFKGGVW